MTAADYRIQARSCFELARLSKTDQERQALRAEGARFTTLAEQRAITPIVRARA